MGGGGPGLFRHARLFGIELRDRLFRSCEIVGFNREHAGRERGELMGQEIQIRETRQRGSGFQKFENLLPAGGAQGDRQMRIEP